MSFDSEIEATVVCFADFSTTHRGDPPNGYDPHDGMFDSDSASYSRSDSDPGPDGSEASDVDSAHFEHDEHGLVLPVEQDPGYLDCGQDSR